LIDRQYRTGRCDRGSGDDEIMRAARAAGGPRVCKKACVSARDGEVVVLDRDRGENGGDVAPAFTTTAGVGELDADQQFRCGDRRDRDVVLVLDELVELRAATLGVDDDRRVDDQSFQVRSSTCSAVRSSRTSSTHPRSRGAELRRAFTSTPRPPAAGPSRATA
jgi:hypothetical protein